LELPRYVFHGTNGLRPLFKAHILCLVHDRNNLIDVNRVSIFRQRLRTGEKLQSGHGFGRQPAPSKIDSLLAVNRQPRMPLSLVLRNLGDF
jgi:hypothetical protein